jgi:hypothetical protein
VAADAPSPLPELRILTLHHAPAGKKERHLPEGLYLLHGDVQEKRRKKHSIILIVPFSAWLTQ